MTTIVVVEHGQLEAMKLACTCFYNGTTLDEFEGYDIFDQLQIARSAGLSDPAELLMALRYFDTISDTPIRVNPVVTELEERDRIRNRKEAPPEAAGEPAA